MANRRKGPPAFKPEDYICSGLDLEDITQIKQTFDVFDVDGRGTINPRDITMLMDPQNYEIQGHTFFQMIKKLEGCDSISFQDFMGIMTVQISSNSRRKEIEKMFSLISSDGSSINFQQFQRVAKELGETMDAKELEEIFDAGDSTGDGQVSLEDFYNILTQNGGQQELEIAQ